MRATVPRETHPLRRAFQRGRTQGILAPARTPRNVVQLLNHEVTRLLETHDVRDKLPGVDFNILTSSPEKYGRLLRTDIATFARIARESGLRVK
jgi:tripartite-type tricarboxylate transporter receptor subunit TctC